MNTLGSSRKPLFPRGPGLGLEFALLLAMSIGLMVADSRGERLRGLREWTSWALQPVFWVTSSPHAVASLGDHLKSREELLAENEALKARSLEMNGRLQRMDALEAENQRIRELLSSATSLQTRVLIAEVLAVSQDPYRHQILLNKGEKDGVYKGQAVVDSSGIMGQVFSVNPDTCIALLITDPEHGIPVEITRTGLQTVALGRGDGQTLSLPYLPVNADVKVGDLLTSSGLGGRFPSGYPVGKVTQLRHPAGENFMEAIADPTARLDQGRQALLVWSGRPSDAATGMPEPAPLPTLPVPLTPPKAPATAHKPGSRHGLGHNGEPKTAAKETHKDSATEPAKASGEGPAKSADKEKDKEKAAAVPAGNAAPEAATPAPSPAPAIAPVAPAAAEVPAAAPASSDTEPGN